MIQPNPPRELLSECQLTRVVRLQLLLRDYQNSGQSVRDYAREHGVAISTLSHYVRRAQMGVSGLIDHREFSSGRKSEVEDSVVAWTVSYLALHPRVKVKGAWRQLEPVARREHWAYPSYQQLLRAISRIPSDIKTATFESSKAHFEQWGIVARQTNPGVNGVWQIDATEFPVWVRDMTSGELFKPYLVAVIDGTSRVVMAAHVMPQAPTTADVLLLLRRAILPKADDRLPFFGVPTELQSDNGSIFRSADYLDALLRLNVLSREIPPDCPSANGKIERWFRTCKTQLATRILGYAKQEKGLEKARGNAIPFPLLQGQVDRYLQEYHLQHHRSLGCTPWEAWHNALDQAQGLQLDPAEVEDALMLRRDMIVQRDGVELLPGRHYHAAELAGLVDETITLRVPPEGPGVSVAAYYRGEKVADLRCVESDPTLAEAIRGGRHDRIVELRKLREGLLTAAAKLERESPGAERVSSSAQPGTAQAEERPLDPIPKLKAEDNE